MASDTAVAEVPSRAFQCFTVFGTSQEREIPNALLGLPRRGGAFAKWRLAQWKLIRYELAALGNIAARESIKREADYKRGWQRQVREQREVAREREAARLAKRKIALEKLERACLKEFAELRRAKAEQDVD